MRSILVGVAVAMVMVVGPAYGGGIVATGRRPQAAAEETVETTVHERGQFHESPPFADVVVEEYHSAGAEFGMGVAATVTNIFYHPVRMAVGVVGAAVGGFQGWITGGDLRTARSMWRPTVEGDYFIRPDHFDRTERYEWGNFRPVARERYTIRGREPFAFEERETVVAEAPAPIDYEAVEAVEPDLEGDIGDDR
jgi:hypothetical protein